MKRAGHYIRRLQQRGVRDSLRRGIERVTEKTSITAQSLWWGWKAGRAMHDLNLAAPSVTGYSTTAALLKHLVDRPESSYLLAHETLEDAAVLIKQRFPDHAARIIGLADAACRGEFDLLNVPMKFEQGIDWHRDPVSGWRWNVDHVSRLTAQLWSGGSNAADLKPIWELNRHQYFVTAGLAYTLTHDEKYARMVVDHITQWIEANPLQHGINWYSSLEIGVRLIAWAMTLQLFRRSETFQPIAEAFLKSVYYQADFLYHHLTLDTDVPNNHIIGEAAGLVIAGAVFPEFKASEQWRQRGLTLLAEQFDIQTHPSGMNKEQATGYHRFCAEFLLLVLLMERTGTLKVDAGLKSLFARMMDYIVYAKLPDQLMPMWGDADDGHAVPLWLNEPFWDFRPVLAAGAVLNQNPAWKFAAQTLDAGTAWLFGAAGLDTWDTLKAVPVTPAARHFKDGGMYILRDDWTPRSDVIFFRAGEFGLGGQAICAHSHCDLLSVQLVIGGQTVLVDSGTYIYHGADRDAFRLTAAHNTLMVDGREQALIRNEFAWTRIPRAKCLAAKPNRLVGQLEAAPGVMHEREIGHPQPGQWSISDTVTGTGTHELVWHFHFAPELTLHHDAVNRQITIALPEGTVATLALPAEVEVELSTGWYSTGYHHRTANPLLIARWRGEIPGSKQFGWTASASRIHDTYQDE